MQRRSSLKRTSSLRRSRLRAVGKRGRRQQKALDAVCPPLGVGVCARCGHWHRLDRHHMKGRRGVGHERRWIVGLCRRCHSDVTEHRGEWRRFKIVGGSNSGT